MHLDIYSDTICPWCFIGKRRLERALAERPEPGMMVTWKAFQLNPDMPGEGMDRRRYLELKFGGPDNAKRIYDRVREAGREEGIAFVFDDISRTPNTIASHRLIRFASRRTKTDAAVSALFDAYFLRGEDIGDSDVLVAVAAAAALDEAEARSYLESGEDAESIRSEDAHARKVGIQGVPTFVLDNKYVLSGAHPPEVLHRFFDLSKQGEAAPSAQET